MSLPVIQPPAAEACAEAAAAAAEAVELATVTAPEAAPAPATNAPDINALARLWTGGGFSDSDISAASRSILPCSLR